MNATAKYIVEISEAFHVSIDNGDAGTEADSHFCGIDSDDASTDDSDAARGDAGHATKQDTAAAVDFLEVGCTDLNGHSASDFAHGLEQGQVTAVIGYGLVGDTSNAVFDELACELASGGEVQIGEQDQSFAQEPVLLGERLFDFDDHFSAGPDFAGGANDRAAGGDVFVIKDSRSFAGT
jgi:hypothetical protein